jgi:hypothetical protein
MKANTLKIVGLGGTLLKQMWVKHSYFNRRINEFLRTCYVGARSLLVCSVVALMLAMLGWWGLFWPAFRWFTPCAFAILVVLAPAFTVVAVMDIRRSGWASSRSIALVCSAVALALMVIGFYQVIYRVYAT